MFLVRGSDGTCAVYWQRPQRHSGPDEWQQVEGAIFALVYLDTVVNSSQTTIP